VIGASALLSAASLAPAQSAPCYRLTNLSMYQDGCLDPCDCVLWPEVPIGGTFRLTLASVTQFEQVYDVTDVQLEVAGPLPSPHLHRTFTGSGTYTRTRPLVGERTHALALDLVIDGVPPARRFESLPAPDPMEFPSINLAVADGGFMCYNVVLDIRAEPACACEMTCDATVDVFDLLTYLDLWLVQDARAEFDGQPGVTLFDLLAYLDCWFPASAGSPCP
jgi:hypothetical protein